MKKIILVALGLIFALCMSACSDKYYEMTESPCADYCLLDNNTQTRQG